MSEAYDVIVVGAGVVGAALSTSLGRAGRRVDHRDDRAGGGEPHGSLPASAARSRRRDADDRGAEARHRPARGDEEDRRGVLVALTQLGESELAIVSQQRASALAEIMRWLEPEDLDTANEVATVISKLADVYRPTMNGEQR